DVLRSACRPGLRESVHRLPDLVAELGLVCHGIFFGTGQKKGVRPNSVGTILAKRGFWLVVVGGPRRGGAGDGPASAAGRRVRAGRPTGGPPYGDQVIM